MQERHIDRKRYFEEQAQTCRKYYIPYIKNHIGHLPHKVLEVGCGEGGNLLPFAESGCEVVGVDIARSRIEQAHRVALSTEIKKEPLSLPTFFS